MGSLNHPDLGRFSEMSDFIALAHLVAMYGREPAPYKIYPVLGAVGAHPFLALCSQDGVRVHRRLHIGFRHDCLLSQPSSEVWAGTTWTPKQFVFSHGSDHPLPRAAYLTLPDAIYLLGLLRLVSAAFGVTVRFLRSEESRILVPEIGIAKNPQVDSAVLSRVADTYACMFKETAVQLVLGGSSHEFTLELRDTADGVAADAFHSIDIELFDRKEFLSCSIRTTVKKGRKKAKPLLSILPLKNQITDFHPDNYERMNLECFEEMIELCARLGDAFGAAVAINDQRSPEWSHALLAVC